MVAPPLIVKRSVRRASDEAMSRQDLASRLTHEVFRMTLSGRVEPLTCAAVYPHSPTVERMEINVSTYAARYAGLLGRLLIAALFLFSAVEKLATPITTIALIRSAGLPLAQLGFLIALVFEI